MFADLVVCDALSAVEALYTLASTGSSRHFKCLSWFARRRAPVLSTA